MSESFITSVIWSGVTTFIGIILGFLGYKISSDNIFKELFNKFNERYNHLNGGLQSIKSLDSYEKLLKEHPQQAYVLNDYLNLCAEEYFWYKKGRIDKKIWKAWQTGMIYWYKELKSLKDLWKAEKKNGNYPTSYYLKKGEDLFIN